MTGNQQSLPYLNYFKALAPEWVDAHQPAIEFLCLPRVCGKLCDRTLADSTEDFVSPKTKCVAPNGEYLTVPSFQGGSIMRPKDQLYINSHLGRPVLGPVKCKTLLAWEMHLQGKGMICHIAGRGKEERCEVKGKHRSLGAKFLGSGDNRLLHPRLLSCGHLSHLQRQRLWTRASTFVHRGPSSPQETASGWEGPGQRPWRWLEQHKPASFLESPRSSHAAAFLPEIGPFRPRRPCSLPQGTRANPEQF